MKTKQSRPVMEQKSLSILILADICTLVSGLIWTTIGCREAASRFVVTELNQLCLIIFVVVGEMRLLCKGSLLSLIIRFIPYSVNLHPRCFFQFTTSSWLLSVYHIFVASFSLPHFRCFFQFATSSAFTDGETVIRMSIRCEFSHFYESTVPYSEHGSCAAIPCEWLTL